MDPERVITNGHSTGVDDERHRPIEESAIDKQNLDPVCK
jgi:hypothetical protein